MTNLLTPARDGDKSLAVAAESGAFWPRANHKSPGGGERVADLMVKAFQDLTEDERLALAAKSIDLEASFRNWMGKLLGEDPYSERIDVLILEGNAEGLRTMAADDHPHLTFTQTKILALTACGLTLDEIGREIRISLEATKSHTKEIRRKLGARNTTHAVIIALASGVFEESLAA